MRIRASISSPGPKHLFSLPVIFILVTALMVTLSTPLFGQDKRTTDTPETKLSKFRGSINRLQQGILQQENKITEAQTTERNIFSELEILDKKVVAQQEKLDTLEKKMREQQVMIDVKQIALDTIRLEKNTVEEHLKKRITAYYTMGDIGLLNVTFSTRTLSELLTFQDAFDVLIKYDQDVIKAYRTTIEDLVRVTTALGLEKAVLADFIEQAVQEKEALQKTKADKKTLLSQVRTQEKLHKQAVIEMQEASESLAQSIVSVKNKNVVREQRFLIDKGRLPPPVAGRIITLFQQEKTDKLGISRPSAGIDIQAANGTKIVSVSDGEVIFSGYLRGYGNTVIVHHGFQYYTVTSRIEKILVKKGQKVRKKDTIGIMGDTATLFDEGLYFEIRHGDDSLDPLLWLKPDKL
ncbi:murein hydrolase activator EnvC family protein [Desulfocastanea catecholica]